ncbi:hypothetical protein DVB69_10290 [Sporosarcina sp. BI001-red]|uniref:YpjP family protein n=1 Tax=Sporosarcina sp. BI001-red TaxID=2282866 RepID=UPI000E266D10|nr:YpjP family protein [Sporosarcina sp. BI001-red]REB07229.1 hypothetical protein DVB69_10290 [Sporosarcina sp. BI001-red]
MKKWLQQLMIISVAFVTFGVISPSHEIWSTLHEKEDVKEADQSQHSTRYAVHFDDPYFNRLDAPEDFLTEEDLVNGAHTLAFTKFGSKIGPFIEDEFDEVIFPQIEQVIRDKIGAHVQMNRKLAISEHPSGGTAEKIFNIKDVDADKNLLLFHVRTEKRPQDGYFFNFHYHLSEDDYQTHHTLGDVYWSKNTPPKWLS